MDKLENKDVIDFGSWTAPDSWKDITLKQFQELERYYADKEKTFDAREVLHILCDKTIDEVNALPMEFATKILDKLSFLQTQPEIGNPTNTIEINGEKYIVNVMEKMRTGEYVTTSTILKSDKYNYAAVLAVLCRKEGEIYDSKYEADVFEDRLEMYENMPFLKIMPVVSFFLGLWGVSTQLSHLYSVVEDAINHTANDIKRSHKIGVWKKYCMNLRMKKLRKLMKSSKNI